MKKIGLIILIAIVALGAMGAGYAAWTQSLNITGTVNTARFDVSMTWSDNGTPGSLYNADPLVTYNTTGLAQPTDSDNTTFTVTTNITDRATYNTSGNAGLDVIITNAVPGTYVIPGVTVHNDSTIPLKISVDTVTGTDLTTAGTQVDDTTFAANATLDPLAVGASTTAADITITIGNSVTQGANLTFTIPVSASQS